MPSALFFTRWSVDIALSPVALCQNLPRRLSVALSDPPVTTHKISHQSWNKLFSWQWHVTATSATSRPGCSRGTYGRSGYNPRHILTHLKSTPLLNQRGITWRAEKSWYSLLNGRRCSLRAMQTWKTCSLLSKNQLSILPFRHKLNRPPENHLLPQSRRLIPKDQLVLLNPFSNQILNSSNTNKSRSHARKRQSSSDRSGEKYLNQPAKLLIYPLLSCNPRVILSIEEILCEPEITIAYGFLTIKHGCCFPGRNSIFSIAMCIAAGPYLY